MQITGTILQVTPPDYTDNYGNQYQNITIQTQAGPVIGRKGSKTPYGVHDVNKQVTWECEQKTNSRGTYNQFRMPQDPQYAQPQQGQPPQPQQAPQQAAGQPYSSPSHKDGVIKRLAILKAIMPEIPLDMIGDYLKAADNYAETGQWVLSPNMLPPGHPVDMADPAPTEVPF